MAEAPPALCDGAKVNVHGEEVALCMKEMEEVKGAFPELSGGRPAQAASEIPSPAKSKPVTKLFLKPSPEKVASKRPAEDMAASEQALDSKPKKSRKGCTYEKQIEKEILREQLRHQNNEKAIPKKHIETLVRDILKEISEEDPDMKTEVYRIQSAAIDLLHSQGEQLVVEVLSLYNRAARQAKRVSVLPRDIAYVRALAEGFNSHLTFVLREDLDRCLKRLDAAKKAA